MNGLARYKLAKRKDLLAVGKACVAVFWRIPGFKGRTLSALGSQKREHRLLRPQCPPAGSGMSRTVHSDKGVFKGGCQHVTVTVNPRLAHFNSLPWIMRIFSYIVHNLSGSGKRILCAPSRLSDVSPLLPLFVCLFVCFCLFVFA